MDLCTIRLYICSAIGIDGNHKSNEMSIQEVQKMLFNERQDYGVYWIVSKLVQRNVPLAFGSEMEGYVFSAWLSYKEGQFILPKLSEKWERGGNFYNLDFMRPYAVISAGIRSGINKNICISIRITPLIQEQK